MTIADPPPTVPRERVERCFELVDAAEMLLVLGSSLHVMSGYRFVLRAAARGIPVALVNQGPTRGDAKAALKIDSALSPVLVVGLPLRVDGKLFNCAAVIHRGRLLGVVPKTFLPNYREFYEKRQFETLLAPSA